MPRAASARGTMSQIPAAPGHACRVPTPLHQQPEAKATLTNHPNVTSRMCPRNVKGG